MGTKRSLRMITLVLLCAVLAGPSGPTLARTIYVDDDALPPGDGSSWTTAFRYLQDAMLTTSAGDEIRVAQGLYRPDQAYQVTEGKRGATFLLDDGVAILGGFAGVGAADPNLRDPDRFATILSGDLTGDDDTGNPLARYNNSSNIVMAPEVGSDTILDGLTICHAYTADHHGGGLYNGGGSPLLRHCTFRDNLASDGDAGVYNDQGHLRIEHCRFLRNSGEDSGALCNHLGSVVVIASEFSENDSEEGAAGVDNEEGDMVLFACLFRGNRGDDGRGPSGTAATTCACCTAPSSRTEDAGEPSPAGPVTPRSPTACSSEIREKTPAPCPFGMPPRHWTTARSTATLTRTDLRGPCTAALLICGSAKLSLRLPFTPAAASSGPIVRWTTTEQPA